MRKMLAILVLGSMLTVGGCKLDGWNLAVGPLFHGDTLYGGIEVEFNNGLDFIVPVVSFGDNF